MIGGGAGIIGWTGFPSIFFVGGGMEWLEWVNWRGVGMAGGFLLLNAAMTARGKSMSFRLECVAGWLLLVGVLIGGALGGLGEKAAGGLVIGGVVGIVWGAVVWLWRGGSTAARLAADSEKKPWMRWAAGALLAGLALAGALALWPRQSGPEQAAAETKAENAAESCPCGGGAVCTGPKGGRYCLTAGGSKRYLGK